MSPFLRILLLLASNIVVWIIIAPVLGGLMYFVGYGYLLGGDIHELKIESFGVALVCSIIAIYFCLMYSVPVSAFMFMISWCLDSFATIFIRTITLLGLPGAGGLVMGCLISEGKMAYPLALLGGITGTLAGGILLQLPFWVKK